MEKKLPEKWWQIVEIKKIHFSVALLLKIALKFLLNFFFFLINRTNSLAHSMLTFILTQARKSQRKYRRVTSCYTFDKLRDDKWIPADTCNNNICSLVANIARVTVSYTNVAVSFTDFRFDISLDVNVSKCRQKRKVSNALIIRKLCACVFCLFPVSLRNLSSCLFYHYYQTIYLYQCISSYQYISMDVEILYIKGKRLSRLGK